MGTTNITLTIDKLSHGKADCSYSADPPTWEIPWVQPDGNLNAPGTSNTLHFELDVDSGYRFVGVQIVTNPKRLRGAPHHREGPIPGTPFTVVMASGQETLTIIEAEARWRGWKTWFYSIGITDDQGNIFWCDPKIYNKGDS